MIFDRWRGRRVDRDPANALYAAAVAQSRQPNLYRTMGAPDTVEGRFELLTLHVILLIDRLRDQPRIRQGLFDIYVSNLDGALREMGVGDLAMGKRMKTLGALFYGRAKACDAAFASLPDQSDLRALVVRTVLGESQRTGGEALANYLALSRRRLAELASEALVHGGPAWAAL